MGSFWGAFWAPKSAQNREDVWEFSIWFAILLFDGPKMAAKTVPRGPKSGPRPSQVVVLGRFGVVFDRFGVLLGSFGVVLGVDSLIRFIDPIR